MFSVEQISHICQQIKHNSVAWETHWNLCGINFQHSDKSLEIKAWLYISVLAPYFSWWNNSKTHSFKVNYVCQNYLEFIKVIKFQTH